MTIDLRLDSMKNTARLVRRLLNEWRHRELPLRPDVRVPHVFLGSEYGGWTVATRLLPPEPLIFSVGLGCDISFDLAAIRQLHAKVYGFDPTPKSRRFIESQVLPPTFHYVPVGLAGYDGKMTLHLPRADHDSYTNELIGGAAADSVECPVARFGSLAQELEITSLDILKMDIEGGEYESIPDILKTPIPVSQLLVELHYDQSATQLARGESLVQLIRQNGYRLFARSTVGKELSFIHESKL
jgi:FkbM family methyltransferase